MAVGLASGMWLPAMSGAWATEGGASTYPNGPELYITGALPPPGDYLGVTSSFYTADLANDSAGHSVTPPDFRLTAVAGMIRYIHVTRWRFLGADWGMHTIVPLISIEQTAHGRMRRTVGISNITVLPVILGWHAGKWHWLASVDLNMRDFNWQRAGSTWARGYWSLEPLFAVTYWDRAGAEASIKTMYDFNFRNPHSGYTSGQEFHFDFDAGWSFGAWNVGPVGYFYQQPTDDVQDGTRVGDGNRGMAFALGPALRYTVPGIQLIAAWQHEFMSENRAQGENIWLRANFSF